MDKLTDLLQALATQLGTTSQYLWSVLVKQAFISGITDLFIYTLLLVACIGEYKWFKYLIKENHNMSDGEEVGHRMGLVISFVLLAIFVIWTLASFSTTLASFFNPEYWALNHILEVIKSGK